jgi:hypothetical protein
MLPLRNLKGDILDHTKVDQEDFERLNTFRLHLNKGSYVMGTIEGRQTLLHRFIMNAKKGDPCVDHINGNKLDNRKSNLRFATRTENAQNKKKKDDCYSDYIGVTYDKTKKTWICQITFEGKKTSKSFKGEEHAAYWYDQLAREKYGLNAKINNIEKPDDFEEPEQVKRTVTHIVKLYNRYVARISHKNKLIHIGTYDTEKEALDAYDKKKEELENKKESERLAKEIIRTKDDVAKIDIISKKINYECLIDDDKYYKLTKHKWHLSHGYAQTKIDGKSIGIHRFLMNPKEDDIIDHINNNPLDNRVCNLRISNQTLNNHNKLKLKGFSKHKGITKNGPNFRASIKKDHTLYRLGTFKTENEAVEAYNKKAMELYGDYARINEIES